MELTCVWKVIKDLVHSNIVHLGGGALKLAGCIGMSWLVLPFRDLPILTSGMRVLFQGYTLNLKSKQQQEDLPSCVFSTEPLGKLG